MRKGAGFYASTAVFIIIMLAMRYLWMPYTGPLTEQWPFYLVRWVFYAMAVGVGNLFFYMTLTNFKTGWVSGFLIPMGIRIGLDALLWLSAELLQELSFSIGFLLDALFIAAAGLSITWTDRRRMKWLFQKMGRPGLAVLALLSVLLLALVIVLQADVFKNSQKFIKGSDGYTIAAGYVAIKAHALSLLISFAVQYVMVLLIVHKRQTVRVRARGIFHCIALLVMLAVVLQLRMYIYPAYFSDIGSSGYSYDRVRDEKYPEADFHRKTSYITFERLNQALERIEEGSILSTQISDKAYKNQIRFSHSEALRLNELNVNGYMVSYFSPYAICYFDGRDQRLLLTRDISSKPEDGMLIEILKQGIMDGDFHCFEYGCEYLLKYAPDFIKPYIDLYAKGEFTKRQRLDMGDIRPEYVMELAQGFAS